MRIETLLSLLLLGLGGEDWSLMLDGGKSLSNCRCLAGLYTNMVELCKLIRPAMRMKKLGGLQFIKEVEQINVKLKPLVENSDDFFFSSHDVFPIVYQTERPNLATISRDNKRRYPTHLFKDNAPQEHFGFKRI